MDRRLIPAGFEPMSKNSILAEVLYLVIDGTAHQLPARSRVFPTCLIVGGFSASLAKRAGDGRAEQAHCGRYLLDGGSGRRVVVPPVVKGRDSSLAIDDKRATATVDMMNSLNASGPQSLSPHMLTQRINPMAAWVKTRTAPLARRCRAGAYPFGQGQSGQTGKLTGPWRKNHPGVDRPHRARSRAPGFSVENAARPN